MQSGAAHAARAAHNCVGTADGRRPAQWAVAVPAAPAVALVRYPWMCFRYS